MHTLVLRDEEPADAAGPVGAGDHLALDLALRPVRVDEPDQRRVTVHASDMGVLHPEADVAAVPVPGLGEIDKDVCLRVQPAARVDQGSEVDTVPSSVKAQFDATTMRLTLVASIHRTCPRSGRRDRAGRRYPAGSSKSVAVRALC